MTQTENVARRLAISLFAFTMLCAPATTRHALCDDALVSVTFVDKDKQARSIDGKILVEAVDGGILVMARDGRLWNITPNQLEKRDATGDDFQYFSSDELGRRLVQEMGDGFRIVQTKHYVICTNTRTRYARWCGALFERLMRGFLTHWKKRSLKLDVPSSPLPAIIFSNRRQFAAFATRDAGPAFAKSKGYYSTRTNRIVLYDLTSELKDQSAASVADINSKLDASLANVATVIHEATHQIAFNSGMHTRYADNPLWLTEGMAMYFETPDLRSRSGWRGIGKVNRVRLRTFRDYVKKRRGNDSLQTLIAGDSRFTDAQTAADAYAESWALTYFLLKTRRKRYVEYLKRVAEKQRLLFDKPEDRIRLFQSTVGEDLQKLDKQFLHYMRPR